MEITVIFVLGAVCGLFLFGMVYTFMAALKMQKQIKDLQSQLEWQQRLQQDSISGVYNSLQNDHRHFDELMTNLNRNLDKRFEDTHRDINHVHQRADEISRYIDSRIDKTIDGLCSRMDTMFVQKESDTTILKS